MLKVTIGISLAAVLLLSSCEVFEPSLPDGNTTLEGEVEGLTLGESQRFLRGDEIFGEVFTKQKGLGPLFNEFSCASCHAGDGKGSLATLFTRFGQNTPGEAHQNFTDGPQLQDKALPGYSPEVLPADPKGTARFLAPAVSGLGFLEAITDQDIIALQDSADLDGDGISGRIQWRPLPSYINPPANAVTITMAGKLRYIHRFGRKAGAFNLLHQTANAFNQDMGIRSSFEGFDTYEHMTLEPEIADQDVLDVAFYLQTLKAPERRNQSDPIVIRGEEVFNSIGCNSCHTPHFKTGVHPISALSSKDIYPYTDLLLHDIGTGESYTEGSAKPEEYKTPALWGLGLSADAQGGEVRLMHDGRASSIEEAILMHDREARHVKNFYKQMPQADKEAILAFLESL